MGLILECGKLTCDKKARWFYWSHIGRVSSCGDCKTGNRDWKPIKYYETGAGRGLERPEQ